MATSFPTSLQDLDATRGTAGQPLSNKNHVTHHTLEDDTIEAIMTKIGVDNSAVTTSLDYKLKSTSSVSPGHKHVSSEITDLATVLLAYVTPPGLISPYGGASAPSGWLLCDGTAVSRTGANAALFAIIGTAYGVGDGSSTFNLPNLKGRTVFGKDAADANFDVLNTPTTYVGEKTHALVTAELPAHNHGVNIFNSSGAGLVGFNKSAPYNSNSQTLDASASAAASSSIGSDTAHNNMPPYRVVNFIIKQ